MSKNALVKIIKATGQRHKVLPPVVALNKWPM